MVKLMWEMSMMDIVWSLLSITTEDDKFTKFNNYNIKLFGFPFVFCSLILTFAA